MRQVDAGKAVAARVGDVLMITVAEAMTVGLNVIIIVNCTYGIVGDTPHIAIDQAKRLVLRGAVR